MVQIKLCEFILTEHSRYYGHTSAMYLMTMLTVLVHQRGDVKLLEHLDLLTANLEIFLQSGLDEATDPWGVKVERVEM